MITTTLIGRRAGGRRSGFTLTEVLVTLAIIAVMAAVLLPAVNSQLSKGDTTRLVSDLKSIEAGAQAFATDLRRYPGTLAQLTAISNSSVDVNAVTIPADLVAKWKGPYLGRDVGVGNSQVGTFATGFTKEPWNGVDFLTVTVTGISAANFEKLDAILDEGITGGSSTGSVRYATAASGTLTFLAMPIR